MRRPEEMSGWLEGGLCTGYEKPVIDADRFGSYQVVLREYVAPPLQPEKHEALEAYVAKRKEALPDAWY